ncbi:MAG: Mosc protein [candidate division Zixibacteria bacterium RBG-1]|nr:MAG: Mosc protein [candidate division Zixibacteria bacterium RBG-1]OGC86273.1 MAG: molybdenum cofactor sulfurase [candidate division Zixibacteria bacterium RBG_19FT_COMBO_42_43]
MGEARLIENFGIENDAHAGNWYRQVSFLASESIEKAKQKWNLKVSFGDFAENIATSGVDLLALQIGDRLKIGNEIIIEITQKGKKCHLGCEIMKISGRCIFPLEGLFGKVLKGGQVEVGQDIEIQTKGKTITVNQIPNGSTIIETA